MSPERVSVREEGEGHSMLRDRRQKWRGNQQWSLVRGIWRLSIRSGVESTGGRVKFKTATERRRSSARNTFIAESVYLVLKGPT